MRTKKQSDPDLEVHTFSDNPFEDLGLPNTAELLARTDLAVILTREIRRRKLTQTKAARLLGISQSDVSNLMRGDVRGFSQDRITRLLTRLDLDVDIQVRPKKRAQAAITIRESINRFSNQLTHTLTPSGTRAWAATASPRKSTKRTKK